MKLGLLLLATWPLAAELVRIEIEKRSPAPAGYERIVGKAHFAVDPKHRLNRTIVDIEHAPVRNGRVEFSADVHILKPVDGGNRTLLFEVSNRGGIGMLRSLQRARRDEFGDQILMKRGYTLAWAGWQHDVQDGLTLYAPKAAGIRGKVRSEFVPNRAETILPLGDGDHRAYRVSSRESLEVTVRDSMLAPRRAIPKTEWRLEGESIHFDKPMQPGRIYEAIYESQDPEIAMLGLAAIRDFVAHMRDQEGVRHALGFGISQSAMLLRALVYHGFNEDEKGRRVFDGMLAHTAGGRRSFLGRFAQPSRTAAPLRGLFYGTDDFPFAEATLRDPVTGVEDGLHRRTKTQHLPKTMFSNSSYEYWGTSASLLHTTLDGKSDLPLPATTRVYMFAGGQHGPAAFPPSGRGTRNAANPNDYTWVLRALIEDLRQWVTAGTEPPASRYPRIADGTLVEPRAVRYPASIAAPDHQHVAYRLSGGEPPAVGDPFVPLVPQVDAGGNDRAGIRMPEIEVPLAAYTGWNYRSDNGELAGGIGSYLPFSKAAIGARYRGVEDYLAKVTAAARRLVSDRLLLEQDVPALVEGARKHWEHRATAGANDLRTSR